MRGSHPKTPAVLVALRATAGTVLIALRATAGTTRIAARVTAGAALVALLFAVGSVPFAPVRAVTPPEDPARELPLLLRKLDETHRILYVTAHPDDEDSALLARLTFGDGVETTLLTLTRGEGGQNEIGTELSHALGVLRSRELQEAGRYLGVRQLFSRAFEFGYSFSVEETFEKWHKPSIVRDVVRVIREFQPDVILTMPLAGSGGGQHHQASARIAAEAMTIAASEDWPELGAPHRTSRLFRDVWESDGAANLCEMAVNAYDPLLGGTYAAFGAASREQHKCQGMARLTDPLEPHTARWEMLFDLEGPPGPVGHLLEGLRDPLLGDHDDPTEIGGAVFRLAAAIRDAYRPEQPSAIVPALLDLWRRLANAPTPVPPRWQTLRDRVARALYLASGLQVTARADRGFVAPGETLGIDIRAMNAGPLPLEVNFALTGAGMERGPTVSAPRSDASLAPGGTAERRFDLRIGPDADATISRPVPERGDRISDAKAARLYTDPLWSAFQLQVVMRIDGEVVPVPPMPIDHEGIDARFPTVVRSDPHVVPDPSVRPRDGVLPFPLAAGRGSELEIELLVSSLEAGNIDVSPHAPRGWLLSPEKREIRIKEPGEEYPVRFVLSPSADAVASEEPFLVTAQAIHRERGRRSTEGYQRIEYPHIRPGALLHEAVVRVVPFEYKPPGDLRVGYVEGAGDRVAEAMQRIGVTPKLLDAEDLLEGALGDLDVIVTGVRAYKVREDLKAAQPMLLDWVRNGGTLLVQYNKLEFNDGRDDSSPFAPFPGTLVGHRRVTVEESPVVVRNPEHPIFTRPNVITEADWRGWVQERGLYFLDFEDARYDDLLEMEDPWPFNAGPQGGALVYARVGKGRWVYIGIGLFRQLPAAVPGAYRLLANMLALGSG